MSILVRRIKTKSMRNSKIYKTIKRIWVLLFNYYSLINTLDPGVSNFIQEKSMRN